MLNPILREAALRAGMPYIRQAVNHNGKQFLVMAYSLETKPSVQLCPPDKAPAPGAWITTNQKWVAYSECTLCKNDALFVSSIEKMQAEWMAKHKVKEPSNRKPMPPPTKPHKATNRQSRQKVKANLKKAS